MLLLHQVVTQTRNPDPSRDLAETVTTSDRDSSGNAGSAGAMRANPLWNDQHAALACKDD